MDDSKPQETDNIELEERKNSIEIESSSAQLSPPLPSPRPMASAYHPLYYDESGLDHK
jgi:hypothetical protein